MWLGRRGYCPTFGTEAIIAEVKAPGGAGAGTQMVQRTNFALHLNLTLTWVKPATKVTSSLQFSFLGMFSTPKEQGNASIQLMTT